MSSYLQELELLERNITMHESQSIMTRWFNLFPVDEFNQDVVKAVYNKIVDAYCASHRHYHTMTHIENMLDKIDEMFNIYKFEDRPEKKFALYCDAYFHDIVYNPQTPSKFSDEDFSAQFAVDSLKEIGITSVHTLERVFELIHITKVHQVDEDLFTDNTMQAIMIDADMSIMGAHREDYLYYAKNIALEYSFVEEKQFRQGRTKFLHDIASRDAIFNTEYMRQVYESDARLNIRTELAALDKLSIDDLLDNITVPKD